MDWLDDIILGVIQGITEFLPVSSTGHLVVAETLLDKKPDLTLNIILHAGTLLAILVFYHRDIWRAVARDRRVLELLVVGTIPVAVVGLVVKNWFRDLTEDPLLTGFMLLITGGVLLSTARRGPGEKDYHALTFRAVLLIGLVQAAAVMPGISRSGVTIVAGLAVGLRRESAAAFSFLLAIPAIGGATALQLFQWYFTRVATFNAAGPPPLDAGRMALAAGVSFVVGLAALWWLVGWLRRGRLHWFGLYCIPLGLAVVAWQLLAN